jgi:RES domain
VHGGLPYDAPQAWSAALHRYPTMPDGIAYTARHDDGAACCALFDRAPSLAEVERRTNLDQLNETVHNLRDRPKCGGRTKLVNHRGPDHPAFPWVRPIGPQDQPPADPQGFGRSRRSMGE